ARLRGEPLALAQALLDQRLRRAFTGEDADAGAQAVPRDEVGILRERALDGGERIEEVAGQEVEGRFVALDRRAGRRRELDASGIDVCHRLLPFGSGSRGSFAASRDRARKSSVKRA